MLGKTHFPTFQSDDVAITLAAMREWFGLRDADDDSQAFTIVLGERLYPDNLVLIDLRPDAYGFHGSKGRVAVTSMERKEPGVFQERDIATPLCRTFPSETVFLNPMREDSGTELTDVLVVTDEVVLVQAKDSPNTEVSLRRRIDRKRAVTRSHIDEAPKQLRGALTYIRGHKELALRTLSGPCVVDVTDRAVYGPVIVRKMFDNDYKACSEPVLAVASECEQTCVLLHYPHSIPVSVSSPVVGTFDRLF